MGDVTPVMRRSRLADRAARYFGVGNTTSMTFVKLGHHRCAFVSPTRMWFYEDEYSERGMVVNLTPTMYADLLDALGGEGYYR